MVSIAVTDVRLTGNIRRCIAACGFTLIEMLVVISIIAILAALLMPALIKARDVALEASCKNNQKLLGMSFLMFSDDHAGYLPGNYRDFGYTGTEAYKNDWLGGCGVPPYAPSDSAKPGQGTIFPYAGSEGVYRCPGLEKGEFGSGVGSNGRFDYTAPFAFTGARLNQIKTSSQVNLFGSWVGPFPTPLILEEDPKRQINAGNRDGGFDPFNYMATTHHSGSNYASLDNSVRWFDLPEDVGGQDWRSRGPRGSWLFLSAGFVIQWGYWGAH